ncbi:helix-turn-helix transcriptional regulator [Aquincola sp. S2]|uniref:Helix-turn-helix transcriptional regulator n=1 Tax=Pseudaquabacterium terrae TaxID=2732868 RepID=A0ABX2EQV7_9BURK|nr:AraC family transcriptional regulator [Aquabacterium terrae]NRF71041.1 helix-turn-helix transcriptional regulator [Aquabacterium terrae]
MDMHPPIETGATASRRPVAGVGRVLLWSGGSLWIGRQAGRVERHAHHAVQITLALDASFRMRGDAADWHEHHGAIVMPHHAHQFDGCGHAVVHLFVEPEAAPGRVLLQRHASTAIADLPRDIVDALVRPLRHAHAQRAHDETLVALARQAIAELAGPAPAPGSVDPRIGRSIAWVRQRLDAPLSLADAAAVAHLSPSRFRHLFVAQTGISFRAYLLWARVETAVAAAMAGQSWTAAAQHAGFADSAHLSRTCRRMFGIAPATLVRE